MMRASPFFCATTGAVIAILSDVGFCAVTGAVMAMDSLFSLPPKIYPATTINPLLSDSVYEPLTVVCASMCAAYVRTSYPFSFRRTVYCACSTFEEVYPQTDQSMPSARRTMITIVVCIALTIACAHYEDRKMMRFLYVRKGVRHKRCF